MNFGEFAQAKEVVAWLSEDGLEGPPLLSVLGNGTYDDLNNRTQNYPCAIPGLNYT